MGGGIGCHRVRVLAGVRVADDGEAGLVDVENSDVAALRGGIKPADARIDRENVRRPLSLLWRSRANRQTPPASEGCCFRTRRTRFDRPDEGADRGALAAGKIELLGNRRGDRIYRRQLVGRARANHGDPEPAARAVIDDVARLDTEGGSGAASRRPHPRWAKGRRRAGPTATIFSTGFHATPSGPVPVFTRRISLSEVLSMITTSPGLLVTKMRLMSGATTTRSGESRCGHAAAASRLVS